ncbi:hypothetical protein ACTWP5_30590 [Streptomyces sp. 4N509B]|uniref:hypothetical protein n=1 Tax=Streptomyces sp. 4N509B TaxID=3457413 RepID=UPI003FD01A3B
MRGMGPQPLRYARALIVGPATVERGDLVRIGAQQWIVHRVSRTPTGGAAVTFASGDMLVIGPDTRLAALRMMADTW